MVKAIEQFYHVKHQSIPLLARAGMKAVRTAARIKGGEYKQIAEAGSVRVAFFEDQNFDSRGQIATFKASMQTTLAQNGHSWSRPWRQRTRSRLTSTFAKPATSSTCWSSTIERHEATVVQATVAPECLAQLMKDPR